MFQLTGELYDAVYAQMKDYASEARELCELVDERVPHATTLLDMACGTGAHMEYLAERFHVSGVDLDTRLLERAHQRCPGAPLYVADICNVDLGRRYDVVTCLFSSIGYLTTRSALNATIANFARHLTPGGLLIVEAWITPDEWNAGHLGHIVVEEAGRKIVRVDRSEVRGRTATVFMDYLIATPAKIEHVSEVHETGLFTRAEYLTAFGKAGLACETLDGMLSERGLYLGRPKAAARTGPLVPS